MNAPSATDGTYWYVANLFGLVTLGTLASAWVLFFTDWFPVVGGLLGLGGLFAWIAFLTNIVSKTRKQQLQTWVDKQIFSRGFSVLVLVAVVLIGIGFALFHGTIGITATEEPRDRLVTIYKGEALSNELKSLVVSARSKRKILVRTPFFGCQVYTLKVAGYGGGSEESFQICRFGVRDVTLPGSFDTL